ncbi:MAG TPA: hypothetical protein VLV89_04090 [Candidatus Acidoferrum sp.]|nr:hypothetical protein [Candidatus Acidoferrum sp.]
MRNSQPIAVILCLCCATVAAQAPPGSADKTDPYNTCIAQIRKAPINAYDPCMKYVDQSPSDEPTRLQYVKKWLAQYERDLSSAKFIQALKAEPNSQWLVNQPDMNIALPQTSETAGPIKIQISRSFADAREEMILREAEAVYPPDMRVVENEIRFPDEWLDYPQMSMGPIWGRGGDAGVLSTEVVTASAVRYYYDFGMAAKKNPQLPTGFRAVEIDLNYDASIKHFDQYTYKKEAFQNVYVADLTLSWDFLCGTLCGAGFTREKIVVLDSGGNVKAMYLDGPKNTLDMIY